MEYTFTDAIGKKYHTPPGRKETPVEIRIWPNVDKSAPAPSDKPYLGNCWVWTGIVNPQHGYVSVWYKKKYWRLHRLVYHLINGPIAKGMVIGHKCNVKHCCRPEHLEEVTQGQNTRDAIKDGLRKAGLYSKEVMS